MRKFKSALCALAVLMPQPAMAFFNDEITIVKDSFLGAMNALEGDIPRQVIYISPEDLTAIQEIEAERENLKKPLSLQRRYRSPEDFMTETDFVEPSVKNAHSARLKELFDRHLSLYETLDDMEAKLRAEKEAPHLKMIAERDAKATEAQEIYKAFLEKADPIRAEETALKKQMDASYARIQEAQDKFAKVIADYVAAHNLIDVAVTQKSLKNVKKKERECRETGFVPKVNKPSSSYYYIQMTDTLCVSLALRELTYTTLDQMMRDADFQKEMEAYMRLYAAEAIQNGEWKLRKAETEIVGYEQQYKEAQKVSKPIIRALEKQMGTTERRMKSDIENDTRFLQNSIDRHATKMQEFDSYKDTRRVQNARKLSFDGYEETINRYSLERLSKIFAELDRDRSEEPYLLMELTVDEDAPLALVVDQRPEAAEVYLFNTVALEDNELLQNEDEITSMMLMQLSGQLRGTLVKESAISDAQLMQVALQLLKKVSPSELNH